MVAGLINISIQLEADNYNDNYFTKCDVNIFKKISINQLAGHFKITDQY